MQKKDNMESASQLIQTMLAPGLMISACGLLLLGMNNKYSLVVNRIRLLNEEKRKARYETQHDSGFSQRHQSVGHQIDKLKNRMALIRNAVFAYSLAVAFFIVSSVLIGLNNMNTAESLSWLVMVCFLSGMVFVFIGIICAAIEVWKGYRIVSIEIADES